MCWNEGSDGWRRGGRVGSGSVGREQRLQVASTYDEVVQQDLPVLAKASPSVAVNVERIMHEVTYRNTNETTSE